MKTIAIIAGDKIQYDQWIREKAKLCNQYVYIQNACTARGYKFDRIVIVGTARELPDFSQREEMVRCHILPRKK